MTIFEKIVAGEIPSFKIWEDSQHYAFLDIRPIVEGHTLLIPKKAADPIYRLSDDEFKNLFLAAKNLSVFLQKKLQCERVCLAVLGYEVPHAHIHLIPTNSASEFPWPAAKQATPDQLKTVWTKLKSIEN